MALKIKKGDNVVVLSGKDKGKNGKVLKIVRLKSDSRIKVVVEGINIVKKHTKQSATSKGGIESIEMPIFISKLALVDLKKQTNQQELGLRHWKMERKLDLQKNLEKH